MAAAENHLIERLPQRDRLRLLALCEPVQLVLAEVLCEPGKPTRHVYFPTEGFISLVALVDGRPGARSRHGRARRHAGRATGARAWCTAPLHALVQGPGAAWRIAAAAFRAELARSAALQRC